MERPWQHTEQQALPEFFPTVIIDTTLGEHLSNFDVDLHAINKTFLENGLTEEQINDTTIVFGGKVSRVNREGDVTQGRYNAKRRQLDNFPARRVNQQLQRLESASDESRSYHLEKMGTFLGWDLGETLRHEMEHRIVHAEGGMPEQKSLDKRQKAEFVGILSLFGAGNFTLTDLYERLNPSETFAQVAGSQTVITALLTTLGITAIAKRAERYYKRSPEEARARKAAEKDFFYITTRYTAQDQNTTP